MIHFWGIFLGGTIARSHTPFTINTPGERHPQLLLGYPSLKQIQNETDFIFLVVFFQGFPCPTMVIL